MNVQERTIRDMCPRELPGLASQAIEGRMSVEEARRFYINAVIDELHETRGFKTRGFTGVPDSATTRRHEHGHILSDDEFKRAIIGG